MKDEGFELTRWSIRNPHPVLAFYGALLLMAVVVIWFWMPRRLMPYVESPMVGIVTMMPGLSALEMETYLSKPIEERMVAVPGVRYVRSTSQDGFSIVTLEFPYDTDMRRALVTVQSLLNVVQADLPVTGANLKPSWVLLIDPLNLPVLTLSLTGDERWDLPRLRQLADNAVVNRLKAASPDVYAVAAYGGYRRQLQVIVDRQKLAAYGLTLADVKEAVDRHNVARPAGVLTGGDHEAIVRVDTLAADAATVTAYPIRAEGDRVVTVGQVARVLDTFAERRSGYRHYRKGESRQAIAVNVLQSPAASSPYVIAAVKRELAALERDYPGIHFEVAYDNSRFVGTLIENMAEELTVAVLLTGLAILLMLGEWRGTVIAMVAVPTCLAITILATVPLGMTLNSSTLIGLLMSIGRLVDDSIVNIHAIDKYLHQGMSVPEATEKGIREVRLPVAASAFMSILGLVPLLFCGGIVQIMFEGLVWPLILGQLSSFFVSQTLMALLASRLLRTPQERRRDERMWLYRAVLHPFQRVLERIEAAYGRLVGRLLRHRFFTMAGVAAALIAGSFFYYFLGSEMMPLADVGQASMILEMQPGTSYAETERAVVRLEKIMARHPELEDVSFEIGSEPMAIPYFTGYSMGFTNGASAMITLSEKDQREKSVWQVLDAVQAEAEASIPGIRRLQFKEMGSDVMASSAAPVQLLVYGPDLNLVSRLGEEVARIARETPGMYQVSTSWSPNRPAYRLSIDLRRAAQVGLSPEQVAQEAYYALGGGFTDEFYRLKNLRQTTILVRFEPDQRRPTPEDLEQIVLAGVPLSTLVRVEQSNAPSLIEHDGFRRVISVTGFYRLGGPYSMDLSMTVMMRAMAELNWPPGYGLEVRGDMTQMMDSFRRLLIGLQLSLLFIFLTLVAQFRGVIQPAQMMLSLPLELSGIFFFLWLNAQAFSTVSILGIIVVTGMDAATAILLIEEITRLRDEGMPRDEAVVTACPMRLRPIVMTNTITILTMLQVAFFPGPGIDAYSPLASVVIGGLLLGTLLSLLVIPVMHTLVDDVLKWLESRRRRNP
ncbi:MAG: efflux RND transporter permease subunit [Candidatus Eremiobacterota bacterium]